MPGAPHLASEMWVRRMPAQPITQKLAFKLRALRVLLLLLPFSTLYPLRSIPCFLVKPPRTRKTHKTLANTGDFSPKKLA